MGAISPFYTTEASSAVDVPLTGARHSGRASGLTGSSFMHKRSPSENGISSPRVVAALMLVAAAFSFVVYTFAASTARTPASASASVAPTFGHPVIAGVGGNGF